MNEIIVYYQCGDSSYAKTFSDYLFDLILLNAEMQAYGNDL